jgi:iron complex outermembrane receptor protein
VVPADPTLTDENTNRDEKSLELSVQDAIRWNALHHLAGPAPHALDRDSIRTDGSAPRHYTDSTHHALAGRELQLGRPGMMATPATAKV